MRLTLIIITAFGLFAMQPLYASTPASSAMKPLSSILKSVEAEQAGRISEAELDDGLWEVKVCEPSGCTKLYIDPVTGKEIKRKKTGRDDLPPEHSKNVSAIVQAVEADSIGRITEVEFEHGAWEIDIDVTVNPVTGEIKSP